VVVSDFNIVRFTGNAQRVSPGRGFILPDPLEAKPVLLVDTDAVLTFPVAIACFKPVGGGRQQIGQNGGGLKLGQCFGRGIGKSFKRPDTLAGEEPLRVLIPASADRHRECLTAFSEAVIRKFQKTGRWPDKTVFAREDRAGTSKGSINKSGMFQTEDLMGVEFHIRDEARFKGGWGFFFTTGSAPAQFIPYSAECYTCHQAHGAVDTTFVQFYPTAKPIAVKAGTYQDKEE
jgi:hypothetical protein